MMFETKWLIHCMFGVTCSIFFNINTIMFGALANVVDIVIAIISIHFSSSHLDFFMYVYILRNGNVIKFNYMGAKSMFRSIITIFNGLFDMVIIIRKYCINWIVSIQNWCISYDKFIYWYFVVFWHSPMMLLSCNQLELMIYVIIEIIKSNCKYRYYVYGEDSLRIKRSIESYQRMCGTPVNYKVMLT